MISHPLEKQNRLVVIGVVVASIVVLALVIQYSSFLKTSLPLTDTPEVLVGGQLKPNLLTLGEHVLEFRAKTKDGSNVSATTSFRVESLNGGGGSSGNGLEY